MPLFYLIDTYIKKKDSHLMILYIVLYCRDLNICVTFIIINMKMFGLIRHDKMHIS